MSERHVRRLNRVRDEYLAASEALSRCLADFDRLRLASDEATIERTVARLPDTYIVRLTAETEGMLYHHLFRFPSGALGSIVIGPKTQASDLVNLSGRHPKKGSAQEMDLALREEAWSVFDYRNGVAQGDKTPKPYLDFATAHLRLVAFVRRLEDASDA